MTKHGMSKTIEYKTWLRMKGMCYNEKHQSYKTYGARGIRMDELWKESFMCFLSDVGRAPEWATGCDLIDIEKDFSKHNFRWVNSQNRRPLKNMPNQKGKSIKRKYDNPKRLVVTFEDKYFKFLQMLAIEKSREEGKPVSMCDFVKSIIESHCPITKQYKMKI